MAESGIGMSSKEDAEITSLKETLCAQQKLLQKLYNELEVEREAAATAASEALSMILRLQGEKAAMKMEAEQYKRLAEEKMCHAEESLSIFEDIICQTEMEVASLDYQVQAYRYKLLSMGCDDPGIGDIKFLDNLSQRNENLVADTSAQSLGRRNSAPPLSLILAYQRRGATERDNSLSPDRDLISKILEERAGNDTSDQCSELERKTDSSSVVDINSFWEEIRKLDGRVKEIAGVDYANLWSGTSSPPLPQLNCGSSSDAMRVTTMNVKDQVERLGASFKDEMNNDSASSSGILDVFEVPQVDQNQDKCALPPKDDGKKILPTDGRLQRPDSVSLEALKSEVKSETDWLKKLLTSSRDKSLRRPIENAGSHRYSAIVQSTTGVAESRSKFNQLNRTSEIVDLGTQALREESSNRGEELTLLNEIKEQLNSIEHEIRSLKATKSSRRDKTATVALMEVSLKEVMLGFWI